MALKNIDFHIPRVTGVDEDGAPSGYATVDYDAAIYTGSKEKLKLPSGPVKRPPPQNTGAAGELSASAWLLRRGYTVFRNVSHIGPADLIAVKGEEVTFIDVTISVNAASEKIKRLQNTNIHVLLAKPNGQCDWRS